MTNSNVSPTRMIAASAELRRLSLVLSKEVNKFRAKIKKLEEACQNLDDYNEEVVAEEPKVYGTRKRFRTIEKKEEGVMIEKYQTPVWENIWDIQQYPNVLKELKSITSELNQRVVIINQLSSQTAGLFAITADKIEENIDEITLSLSDDEFKAKGGLVENIYYNKYDAANNDVDPIDKNKILDEYWTDTELTFKRKDNDTYVIYKGDVAMGFTTAEMVKAITQKEHDRSVDEIIDDTKEKYVNHNPNAREEYLKRRKEAGEAVKKGAQKLNEVFNNEKQKPNTGALKSQKEYENGPRGKIKETFTKDLNSNFSTNTEKLAKENNREISFSGTTTIKGVEYDQYDYFDNEGKLVRGFQKDGKYYSFMKGNLKAVRNDKMVNSSEIDNLANSSGADVIDTSFL